MLACASLHHSIANVTRQIVCFVDRASRYNRVKKNQLDAQLIPGTFRQPLHVSGVSRPIIRRYRAFGTEGTRLRMGGEVKGKDANGVGSQQPCTARPNMVYPALLPTIKTCDKLASGMVSRELSSNIRQFQHHSFHIILNYC